MSPDTTFLYFLLLLFSLFFIIGVLVPWLARKWYVRRNGHPRKRRHANDTHRKLTFGVIAVTIFVSLFANVLQLLPALPGLIVLLGCLFIYVTGSTYLWKKESSNKDDYRYEMLVNGGISDWRRPAYTGMGRIHILRARTMFYIYYHHFSPAKESTYGYYFTSLYSACRDRAMDSRPKEKLTNDGVCRRPGRRRPAAVCHRRRAAVAVRAAASARCCLLDGG